MSISTLVLNNIYQDFVQGDEKLALLKGISLVCNQGESYAIIGASGSGKSTLFHILGGLAQPTSGSVEYNGVPISSYTHEQKSFFLNKTIGFVFQFHYLIAELTVLENVMLTGLISGEESYESCRERASLLLDDIGLGSKKESYPTYLSGGEQQRVSVARALFNRPAFLVADEPTGSLDSGCARDVIDLLVRAQQEWRVGIIMCSHDPDVYSRMQNIYRLHDGFLNRLTQ